MSEDMGVAASPPGSREPSQQAVSAADAASIPSADPWRFKAVIEGQLVHISATFGLSGIETFRRKLLALATVLDEPAQGTEAGTAETEGLGPKDDGPVVAADAPNPCPNPNNQMAGGRVK